MHHFYPLRRGSTVKMFSQSTPNELNNDKAVNRTATATPSLVNTMLDLLKRKNKQVLTYGQKLFLEENEVKI